MIFLVISPCFHFGQEMQLTCHLSFNGMYPVTKSLTSCHSCEMESAPKASSTASHNFARHRQLLASAFVFMKQQQVNQCAVCLSLCISCAEAS